MNKTYENKVDDFIDTLKKHSNIITVFNPWADSDENFDTKNAVEIRCNNLKKYLLSRENAEYVLVAEAPGHRGCRFSGIPLTSERIIKKYELEGLQRSSAKKGGQAVKESGFAEPTATIVWEIIGNNKKFVFWNIFPFHPYKPEKPHSNRHPSYEEIDKTSKILKEFLKLFPKAQVFTVGKIAEKYFNNKDIKSLRHPCFGGKEEFKKRLPLSEGEGGKSS